MKGTFSKLLVIFLIPFFGILASNGEGIKVSKAQTNVAKNNPEKGLKVLEEKLNRKLKIQIDKTNSVPVFVGGKLTETGFAKASDKSKAAKLFLAENFEIFGIQNPEEELKEISKTDDELSMTHIKYNQQINGIKIFQGQLYVHFNADGSIESVNGRYFPSQNLNAVPSLKSDDAIRIAKDHLKNHRSENQKAETIFYEKEGKLILTYAVKLPTFYKPNMTVFVDANTGEIIKVDDGIRYDGPTQGTGKMIDGSTVSLNTFLENGIYYLYDETQPMWNPPTDSGVVLTYDANNDTTSENPYASAVLVSDPNNDNKFDDNERLKAAVTAHYYSQKVYDFYRTNFNRNSIDDNALTVMSVVHFQEDFNNAFWNGVFMTYGNGDGFHFSDLTNSFDVASHEMTHGVIQYTADLIYENQSGALNESYADVFGVLVDPDDWLIGEDIYTPHIQGDGLRSLKDPHNGGYHWTDGIWQPAHMDEFVELPNTPDDDNGGVHVNSGIPNKAFYNVANVIGREKAGKIWYRSLTNYLTNNAKFIDARIACLNSAKDLFGENSTEYNAVEKGFDDVGIIEGNIPGETLDMIYDDNFPDYSIWEETGNTALAVKFTPSLQSYNISEVSIYISGDQTGGNGNFNLAILKADGSNGMPGSFFLNPSATYPVIFDWNYWEITGPAISGDFYVAVYYNGTNKPRLGADQFAGSKAGYEYDGNSWAQLKSPDDYQIFMRAKIKGITTDVEIDTKVPEKFELAQNYPNPFNPSTTIKYALPYSEKVQITVYDVTGRQIAELINSEQNAGTYEVTWNGNNNAGAQVSSGIYFYIIKAGSFVKTNKMMLIK